jgi:tetratricopeptide (TPR) repeat protein
MEMMRGLSRLVLTGFVAAAIAVPTAGQRRSDDQIAPKSTELMQQARSLAAAGKYEDAQTALEASLAVDPRNRYAYVEAARVAEKQKLYGKAIRFTNKALAMEPRDLDALAVQGTAMVELGAVARAKDNLTKIKAICTKGCPQATLLASVIGRGPTVASATVPKQPEPKDD